MANETISSDPKWRRLPEERPLQILHAAVAVFGEQGINGAKLEDIAARAGVSKGTIYLYFESKEELFREVVRQILVPRVAEAERLVTAEKSASAQIEQYLRSSWRHFDHPEAAGWIRLVLNELHKHPDLLQFYYDEVVKKSNALLGEVVQRGIERGEIRAMDPISAVRLIKSMLLMHVMWVDMPAYKLKEGSRSREQVIDEIVAFSLAALRPDGATR